VSGQRLAAACLPSQDITEAKASLYTRPDGSQVAFVCLGGAFQVLVEDAGAAADIAAAFTQAGVLLAAKAVSGG
jgi:hypothetical protein